MEISKILIANRGEIAVRIIRTARRMGIATVAVFHESDSESLHVELADEAFSLGNGTLADTYLNIPKLISLACMSRCDAIHPGYGFLSENHLFAQACQDAGLIFIGPSPESILLMGNKLQARDYAMKSGLPLVPAYTIEEGEDIPELAENEFPYLIKAAAGGGGKGMRIVHNSSEMKEAIASTRREAKNYFGDPTVFIEKYIEEPRHIEVQVLGDKHGNVIHLFERECTIQRRYQKIIEESPSATLTPDKRSEICESAVRFVKTINYYNAGTIEFLMDKHQNFYFLEMNTRIQVEHPVTEMVTGVDIVEEQINIASGKALGFKQEDIHQNGHAIECRIYAEDPANNFLPSPGFIHYYSMPKAKNIRVDSYINENAEISGFFDPMISKLIVRGINRKDAIEKSIAALNDVVIHGIKTNTEFLKGIIQHQDFQNNNISTTFCRDETDKINSEIETEKKNLNKSEYIMAALLYRLSQPFRKNPANIWQQISYWRHFMQIPIRCEEITCKIKVENPGEGKYIFTKNDRKHECQINDIAENMIDFSIDNERFRTSVSIDGKQHIMVRMRGYDFEVKCNDILGYESVIGDSGQGSERHDNDLVSPMPGKVIDVRVKPGDKVSKGEIVAIIESMKMENNIIAPFDSIVEGVYVEKGSSVGGAELLVRLKI
ncbi:MAG: acetyl-CoA carboxylase biotin carboxylase subunit [Bacteroidales bacterium]